jgi:hypothetical protein
MIPSTANFDNIIKANNVINEVYKLFALFSTGETGEDMRGT